MQLPVCHDPNTITNRVELLYTPPLFVSGSKESNDSDYVGNCCSDAHPSSPPQHRKGCATYLVASLPMPTPQGLQHGALLLPVLPLTLLRHSSVHALLESPSPCERLSQGKSELLLNDYCAKQLCVLTPDFPWV